MVAKIGKKFGKGIVVGAIAGLSIALICPLLTLFNSSTDMNLWGALSVVLGVSIFAVPSGIIFGLILTVPSIIYALISDSDEGSHPVKVKQTKPVPHESASPAVNPHADKLQRATQYRLGIMTLLSKNKRVASVSEMATRLKHWETQLQELVARLNAFEANKILQQGRLDVPQKITYLQTQLELETNASIRSQLDETLTDYLKQQQELDALATLMRRTELEIDKTLASMGTLYSQLQLEAIDAKHQQVDKVAADVDEQLKRLNALAFALEETYQNTPLSFLPQPPSQATNHNNSPQ